MADALDFPLPLVQVTDRIWALELFHGPTAAFKDFGARFLAACLQRLQAGRTRPLKILVAFIQTFIFCKLAMLYIAAAVEEAEHH